MKNEIMIQEKLALILPKPSNQIKINRFEKSEAAECKLNCTGQCKSGNGCSTG